MLVPVAGVAAAAGEGGDGRGGSSRCKILNAQRTTVVVVRHVAFSLDS